MTYTYHIRRIGGRQYEIIKNCTGEVVKTYDAYNWQKPYALAKKILRIFQQGGTIEEIRTAEMEAR